MTQALLALGVLLLLLPGWCEPRAQRLVALGGSDRLASRRSLGPPRPLRRRDPRPPAGRARARTRGVDSGLGWLPGVRRSTEALADALEEWADLASTRQYSPSSGTGGAASRSSGPARGTARHDRGAAGARAQARKSGVLLGVGEPFVSRRRARAGIRQLRWHRDARGRVRRSGDVGLRALRNLRIVRGPTRTTTQRRSKNGCHVPPPAPPPFDELASRTAAGAPLEAGRSRTRSRRGRRGVWVEPRWFVNALDGGERRRSECAGSGRRAGDQH